MIRKVKKNILGKEREIVFDGEIGFLNKLEDEMETGIFCGLTESEWDDEKLLLRIRAKIGRI